MKTKEIDVWVKMDSLNKTLYGNPEIFWKEGHGEAKAKLIIEIPEKKIEITESDFDYMYNEYVVMSSLGCNFSYENFKEQLGFTND